MFGKKDKEKEVIRIVEKVYNPDTDKLVIIVKNEKDGEIAPSETCETLAEALNDFKVAVTPDVIKEVIILRKSEE